MRGVDSSITMWGISLEDFDASPNSAEYCPKDARHTVAEGGGGLDDVTRDSAPQRRAGHTLLDLLDRLLDVVELLVHLLPNMEHLILHPLEVEEARDVVGGGEVHGHCSA